jgi:hypothetical protein
MRLIPLHMQYLNYDISIMETNISSCCPSETLFPLVCSPLSSNSPRWHTAASPLFPLTLLPSTPSLPPPQIPTGNTLKLILLGDSAVGKSKLVERFLMDGYKPHQLSTYALTLFRHTHRAPDGTDIPIDIWDTAGQERFNNLHPSYYYKAHACIMVFDVTRKVRGALRRQREHTLSKQPTSFLSIV